MEVIVVSGTPGTGKTFVSKKIAKKLKFYYLDVNKAVSKYTLLEGYDKKRKTMIVDTKKLNKFLVMFIKNLEDNKMSKGEKGVVIDSHLSHYLPKEMVGLCIITKCDIRELSKRLKNKKFSKSKIKENLEAEIFNVCYNEALEIGHDVLAADTTKGFNINKIANKIRGE